jgi:hypothetical protein
MAFVGWWRRWSELRPSLARFEVARFAGRPLDIPLRRRTKRGVERKTRALPNDQIFGENLSGHQERSP